MDELILPIEQMYFVISQVGGLHSVFTLETTHAQLGQAQFKANITFEIPLQQTDGQEATIKLRDLLEKCHDNRVLELRIKL